MEIEKVKAFAIEQGYQTVKYVFSENGIDYYYPGFNDGEVHYIGLPYRILVEGDKIRISTPDETMDIFHKMLKYLPSDEDSSAYLQTEIESIEVLE